MKLQTIWVDKERRIKLCRQGPGELLEDCISKCSEEFQTLLISNRLKLFGKVIIRNICILPGYLTDDEAASYHYLFTNKDAISFNPSEQHDVLRLGKYDLFIFYPDEILNALKEIILVEDDTEMRQIVFDQINMSNELNCQFSFANFEDLIEHLKSGDEPDAVLTDLKLPGMNGIEGIQHLKEIYPTLKICIYSQFNDSSVIVESFKAGAHGYITKTAKLQELIEGIKKVANGHLYINSPVMRKLSDFFRSLAGSKNVLSKKLSKREKELADDLIDGLTYLQIAEKRFISIETVRHHVKNIYRKLGLNSRDQLLRLTNPIINSSEDDIASLFT